MKYKIITVALVAIGLLVFAAIKLNTYERRQKYLKTQAQIQALELEVQRMKKHLDEAGKKESEKVKKELELEKTNASPSP